MRDFILPPAGGPDELASDLIVNGYPVPVSTSLLRQLDSLPPLNCQPTPEHIHQEISAKLAALPNRASTLQGMRALPHGQTGKRIIYFQSRKNGGSIPTESRLEAAFALCLEAHHDVEHYRGQPVTLVGTDFAYTPDFVARLRDGRLVVFEVKPGGRLTQPELQFRLLRIQRWFAAARIDFQIVTDAMLSPNNELINLQYIYRRATFTALPELASRMHARLEAHRGAATLRDVRTYAMAEGWPAAAAEGLVWDGHLDFDRNMLLTSRTALRERAS